MQQDVFYRMKRFYWIIFLANLCPYTLWSQYEPSLLPEQSIEGIQIDNTFESQLIGQNIAFFKSESTKISLVKIMEDSLNYPFEANRDSVFQIKNFGKNEHVWLHFQVQNMTNRAITLYLEADQSQISDFEFFEILNNSQYGDYIHTGNNFDFETRNLNYRNFVFEINLAPRQLNNYYFYLNTEGKSLYLPLKLYRPLALNQKNYQQLFWMGGFYGAMLVLVILSLVLFGALQQGDFLFFGLFLVSSSFLFATLQGLGFQFFWSKYPYFDKIAVSFWSYLSAFLGFRFLYHFIRYDTIFTSILTIIKLLSYLLLSLFILSLVEKEIVATFTGRDAFFILSEFSIYIYFASLIVMVSTGFYQLFYHFQKQTIWIISFGFVSIIVGFYIYGLFRNVDWNWSTLPFLLWGVVLSQGSIFIAQVNKLRLFHDEQDLQKIINLNKWLAIREHQEEQARIAEEQGNFSITEE